MKNNNEKHLSEMVGAFLMEKTMVTLVIIGLLVLKEGINQGIGGI